MAENISDLEKGENILKICARLLNGIPLCNRVRHLARSLTPMLTIPHISAAVNEISHRKEDA
mgnify:CR=1 FL=1